MFDAKLVFGIMLICLCGSEAAILASIQQSATKYESNIDTVQTNKFSPPQQPPPPSPSVVVSQLSRETQNLEPILMRQRPTMRKYPHDPDRAIRVTVNDLRNRFARLENMIGILERVSYAISRPAAIVDAIRLFALAISSVIVSSLDYS